MLERESELTVNWFKQNELIANSDKFQGTV